MIPIDCRGGPLWPPRVTSVDQERKHRSIRLAEELLFRLLGLLPAERLDLAEQVASEIGIGICFLQQTKFLFGFAQQAGVGVKQAEGEM